MFNLPWYAWFNVLALPCLWLLFLLGMALEGQPKWQRKLIGLHVLGAIVTIFLYWNPAVSQNLTAIHYVLAVLVVPIAVWNLGITCQQLILSFLAMFFADAKDKSVIAMENDTQPQFDVDDDEIDLDVGCPSPEGEEQRAEACGEAISALFSGNSSAKTRLESVDTLLGVDDEAEEPGAEFVALLINGAALSLLTLPPVFMSLRMAFSLTG